MASGSSLEIIDPRGSSSDRTNWRASQRFGGTPGAPPDEPDAAVVVNEILDGGASGDRVELKNIGSQPVDVGNWYVSDTSADYFKYKVPAKTTIANGGYVTLRLEGSAT